MVVARILCACHQQLKDRGGDSLHTWEKEGRMRYGDRKRQKKADPFTCVFSAFFRLFHMRFSCIFLDSFMCVFHEFFETLPRASLQ